MNEQDAKWKIDTDEDAREYGWAPFFTYYIYRKCYAKPTWWREGYYYWKPVRGSDSVQQARIHLAELKVLPIYEG